MSTSTKIKVSCCSTKLTDPPPGKTGSGFFKIKDPLSWYSDSIKKVCASEGYK